MPPASHLKCSERLMSGARAGEACGCRAVAIAAVDHDPRLLCGTHARAYTQTYALTATYDEVQALLALEGVVAQIAPEIRDAPRAHRRDDELAIIAASYGVLNAALSQVRTARALRGHA